VEVTENNLARLHPPDFHRLGFLDFDDHIGPGINFIGSGSTSCAFRDIVVVGKATAQARATLN
jgi:hypothetical protein